MPVAFELFIETKVVLEVVLARIAASTLCLVTILLVAYALPDRIVAGRQALFSFLSTEKGLEIIFSVVGFLEDICLSLLCRLCVTSCKLGGRRSKRSSSKELVGKDP